MHVHDTKSGMRTTVEMKSEHRAALLTLAASRGQKGFSEVLGDAISAYLRGEEERETRNRLFHSLAGTLTEDEGNELESEVETVRASWR